MLLHTDIWMQKIGIREYGFFLFTQSHAFPTQQIWFPATRDLMLFFFFAFLTLALLPSHPEAPRP